MGAWLGDGPMASKSKLKKKRMWVLRLTYVVVAPFLVVMGYNAWMTRLNQRDRALVREALPFGKSEKWLSVTEGLRRIRSVVGERLYENETEGDQIWYSIRDREIIWPMSHGFHVSCLLKADMIGNCKIEETGAGL